jgi:hypothetical protein
MTDMEPQIRVECGVPFVATKVDDQGGGSVVKWQCFHQNCFSLQTKNRLKHVKNCHKQHYEDFAAREAARKVNKQMPPLNIPLNPAWRTMLCGELAREDEVSRPRTAPGGAAAH